MADLRRILKHMENTDFDRMSKILREHGFLEVAEAASKTRSSLNLRPFFRTDESVLGTAVDIDFGDPYNYWEHADMADAKKRPWQWSNSTKAQVSKKRCR